MPIGFSWISLDSLVRIETYQWVTRILAEGSSSGLFPLAFEPTERESAVEAIRKGRLLHEASLIWFLFFCKQLWALIAVAVDRAGSKSERETRGSPEGVMAGLAPAIHVFNKLK
jgi:hypothetical protein